MKRFAIAVMASGAVLAVAAPAASALTRAEYVTQANNICTQQAGPGGVSDINRATAILSKAKSRADLKKAGRLYVTGAKLAAKLLDQIALLSPPPADAAVLSRWVGDQRGQVGLLVPLGKALKQGANTKKLVKLAKPVDAEGKRADQLVIGFGFNSCLV
jgi:hypothetical protein